MIELFDMMTILMRAFISFPEKKKKRKERRKKQMKNDIWGVDSREVGERYIK